MIRLAVIDTNVLVSALLTSRDDAATVRVVARALAGAVVPLYSAAITREYREVLHRAKFGFSPELVEYLVAAMERDGISVAPAPSGVTLPDSQDLPFYEAVLEKRADGACLVTGNLKHFPQEPFIVSPARFLALLDGRDS